MTGPPKTVICPTCNGSQWTRYHPKSNKRGICMTCKGLGFVPATASEKKQPVKQGALL